MERKAGFEKNQRVLGDKKKDFLGVGSAKAPWGWVGARFPPRTPSRPSCELFRALTSGLFVARPKLLPPGHARPATGWLRTE